MCNLYLNLYGLISNLISFYIPLGGGRLDYCYTIVKGNTTTPPLCNISFYVYTYIYIVAYIFTFVFFFQKKTNIKMTNILIPSELYVRTAIALDREPQGKPPLLYPYKYFNTPEIYFHEALPYTILTMNHSHSLLRGEHHYRTPLYNKRSSNLKLVVS